MFLVLTEYDNYINSFFWYLLLTLRVLVLDVLPSSLSFIFYVVLCNSKGKVN